MKSTTFHCDPARLKQLLDGSLSEHDEADVVRHLDTCPRCQGHIEGLAAESQLWGDARRLDELMRLAPRPEVTQRYEPRSGDVEPAAEDSALEFLAPSDLPGVMGLLGPYEVKKVIGRGGMGVVFHAFDPALHRPVAIKVLAPELATSAAARRRFAREAKAAAAIVHEHIIPIYTVEPNARLPYIVMQAVPGRSLQERIDKTGPLDTKDILRIGMQTASGLAAAHALGLVHRDIKPANILLENGVERVKITDFGLARAIDDASLTQSGIVAGTPQYMSPEQARGDSIDHRTDLFSLGSVLYAMCTGRSPFRAETTMAVLRRVSDDEPRPILEINPDVPEWLAAIIAKLHAKDPEWRFQSAAEVADLLGRCLAYAENPAEKTPPFAKPARSSSRRPTRPVVFAFTAIVALAVGLGAAEATGVAKVSDFVATVLRIVRRDGSTMVVKLEDPEVKVRLDGEEVVILDAGPQEIRVRPGNHELSASKSGGPEATRIITINRGEKKLVEVGVEPGTAQAKFVDEVGGTASSPADSRLKDAEESLRQTEAILSDIQRDVRRFHSDPRGKIYAQKAKTLRELVARLRSQPGGPVLVAPPSAGSLPGAPPADTLLLARPDEPNVFVGPTPVAPPGDPFAAGRIVSAPDVPPHPVAPPGSPLIAQQPIAGVEAALAGRLMVDAGNKADWVFFAHGEVPPRSTLRGPQERRLWTLTFSPDGKTLATGAGVPAPSDSSYSDDRGELTLWDTETGQLQVVLGQSRVVRSLAFSPDGKVLATVGFQAEITLRDAATGRVLSTFQGPEQGVNAVTFSPDGRSLITAGLDTIVRVWDVASGEERASLDASSGDLYTVAVSPDGKSVLAGGADTTARLWDLDSKEEKFALRGHQSAVESVAFSPDGKILATASWDRTVKLWDAASGKEIATLGGNRCPVLGVVFSPDGKALATCGGNWPENDAVDGPGEVRLWDLASKTVRISLPGHAGRVFDVVFSPDGKTLATASWDAAVRLWDVDALDKAASERPYPHPPVGDPFGPGRPGLFDPRGHLPPHPVAPRPAGIPMPPGGGAPAAVPVAPPAPGAPAGAPASGAPTAPGAPASVGPGTDAAPTAPTPEDTASGESSVSVGTPEGLPPGPPPGPADARP